ncbi:low molecular weight protein-tyrosine-phosphatase [Polycladidibacter stylochi]|uniref:low molecular weight protein-tyrosine-phosphatase n=1 Tax=Polycladidibacter stylochi TaxID=1807766 RepID=UPI00083065E1|nr:low molecular weight protein-tyrosine-phosphatase [Pseudovibrio stylochi]
MPESAQQQSYGVMFVCLGNICRSPLAEGRFRYHVEQAGLSDRFHIGSSGTGAWHAGNPPDPRSIAVAAKYATDISQQRAQQVQSNDFLVFDRLVAMDLSNLKNLQKVEPADAKAKLQVLLGNQKEVPDPYYGGDNGFETVFAMVDKGTKQLLADIRAEMGW